MCNDIAEGIGYRGDWQFFDPRLLELQELELNYQKKLQDFQVPLGIDKTMTAEELEAERVEEQADIDNGQSLLSLLVRVA